MLKNRIKKEYISIKKECAITTASCDYFAPFLIGMLHSLLLNFPLHPKIYIADLGMNKMQKKEIEKFHNVEIFNVESFSLTWNQMYSWKFYAMLIPKKERYIFHIDAGTIILRDLSMIFLSIKKNHYFTIAQTPQRIKDIIPEEYINVIAKESLISKNEEVFAAGIFGYDKYSIFGNAIIESHEWAKKGATLGYSKCEIDRIKKNETLIIRKCKCFRHDQTILNIVLRKYRSDIKVRNMRKYLGVGNPDDHPHQYIWLSRQSSKSLRKYFYLMGLNGLDYVWIFNRISFLIKRRYKKLMVSINKRFGKF